MHGSVRGRSLRLEVPPTRFQGIENPIFETVICNENIGA
jgi:hypothetical protein